MLHTSTNRLPLGRFVPGLIALFLLTSLTRAASTIRISAERLDGSEDLVAAVISCQPPPAPGELAQFNLMLTFDSTLLRFQGVRPAQNADSSWRISYLLDYATSIDPDCLSLSIRGRRPASYVPGSGPADSVLARVLFRPITPPRIEPYAPVSFFWSSCRDNLLLLATSPRYLVSSGALDPDGVDITSESVSPPTVTGLCNDCLPELALGDTLVYRNLLFQSVRLPLDLATTLHEPSSSVLPSTLVLEPNYPNPFNAGTTIQFACPPSSTWTLSIYDLLGRTVRSFSGRAPGGREALSWDGLDRAGDPVASGIYLYRLTAGAESRSRKMLLLK